MRPEEEYSLEGPDYKERALSRLRISAGYNKDSTFIFYEDDPQVITMYVKYGIVLKCPDAWDFLNPIS